MTKEIALKIVEKLLDDNYKNYHYDKKALNKINEACGNYRLEYLSNDEIYIWLHGIWTGLIYFNEAKLKRKSKNDDR